MKAIISGPTGAIGHTLIDVLLENNDEVLAICHRGSKRIKQLPNDPRLKILELNIEDFCEFIPEEHGFNDKYDAFYHLAWNGPVGSDRNDVNLQLNNIRFTLDAVNLANRFNCSTFIGAGSQAEYGRVEGMLKPDTPAFPENGYGMAKLCAGQLSRLLCSQLGIKHIWTRILSVYGPYDGNYTMIMKSLGKFIRGEEVEFTKAEQKWDYIYSKDAARALYLLADKGVDGKIYVIGSGNRDKLSNYITKMHDFCNSKSNMLFGAIPYSDKQVMNLCADISELSKDTGFYPEVEFEEGIKKTIDYVKDHITDY